MSQSTKPTAEWEHSHALTEGDELTDAEDATPITVEEVRDDGSVVVHVWTDQRHGQEYTTETYSEEAVRVALRDGLWKTINGKSHELATF